MTISEILSLPTEDLAKLSANELDLLLGPNIPLSRKPDKERAEMRDVKQLMAAAKAMLGQS